MATAPNSLPDTATLYRATVIENALRLYARAGARLNRAYTPNAMMRAAREITGQPIGESDYLAAANALKAWRDAAERL